MIKKIISLISCFIFGLLVIGCDKEKDNTFKYVGLKVYDPVYIANDLGYFEELGLDLEIIDTVAGGSTAIQMVASGDIQAGLASTMALINAKANGLNVVGVADIQSSFNEYPLEEFYVKKDSNINTINDLKNKNLAINLVKSSFHYTFEIALASNNISNNEVNYISLSFDQQIEALKRNQVDVIGLMQPYASQARNDEELKLLFDACDIFGEKQFCLIYVNEEYAKGNQDKVKKFVSAIAKACDFVENNQDKSKEIISKYTGVDVSLIDDYKFQENAMVIEDDINYWLDYMRKAENVGIELNANDIATNIYNERV